MTGSTATTTVTTSATLVPSSFTPSASSTADTDKQQERRPSWRLRMESGDRSRVSTVPYRSSVVDPHHPDADPDPTFHPDPDPDLDPSFKKKVRTLEKCYNMLIFHTFWLDIYKLMRIRFRIQLVNIDADPDFI
jgi:hypothetical protein